jgi:hypothetical protein
LKNFSIKRKKWQKILIYFCKEKIKMYYSQKKINFGAILTIVFLITIIVILVNLINKLDIFLNLNQESQETGTDTVLNEFSTENLVENVSYSIVRSFEIK